MSRKIALPLLVAAALVSIILASRTPQPIIEELPPEEADAPTVLTKISVGWIRHHARMKAEPPSALTR